MNKKIVVMGAVASLAVSVFADATLDNYINQKKYNEAIDYANKTLLPPQKRTAKEWDQLAKAYLGINNETRALATYTIASRMNPKDGTPLAGIASIYFEKKEYEKAFENGKKAFSLTPNDYTAWQYARAAIKVNKPTEAKKALEKVIASDPNNVAANSMVGSVPVSLPSTVLAPPLTAPTSSSP